MGAAMAHHHLQRDLKKPTIPSPTLYAKGVDPPEFDSVCALVLTALGDQYWNGDWELDEKEKEALLKHIEKVDVTGKNADDGKLTLDEIMVFIDSEDGKQIVRDLPASVNGLLEPELVKMAVDKFDSDKNGCLDDKEWDAFLEKLEVLRIRYLLRLSFQSHDTFYGRGQPWFPENRKGPRDFPVEELLTMGKGALVQDQPEEQVALKNHDTESNSTLTAFPRKRRPWVQIGRDEDAKGGRCGIIPPGWWDDFVYFSANMHPLHGIFCCDRNNRLNSFERVAMEIAAIGFTFFGGRLKTMWVHDKGAPIGFLTNELAFDYLVITIPSLIFRKILFYLFTCPCCILDESRYGENAIKRARLWTLTGERLGFILTVLGVVLLIVRVAWVAFRDTGHYYVWDIGLSCVMSYLTVWATIFLLQFNLFICIGQSNKDHASKLQEICLGLFPVGQWRLQKQRFQNRCIDAAEHLRKEASGRNTEKVFRESHKRLSVTSDRLAFFRCCGVNGCVSCM